MKDNSWLMEEENQKQLGNHNQRKINHLMKTAITEFIR
jgi:hypothetical protein